MTSIALAAAAAIGTHLLLTAGRSEAGSSRQDVWRRLDRTRRRTQDRLGQAGLTDVSLGRFTVTSLAAGMVSAVVTAALFGTLLPAVLVGTLATAGPATLWRRRRERRRQVASEAWPSLIEELRVLTGSVGRSVPQALLEVGLRGPEEMRPGFDAARREWHLTTDFDRTVSVLKAHLEDPTADTTCETLLVASQVGGDLDGRLAALAEDRRIDLRQRKEARAKQAGARLARSFVILVPAGMALAGMNVGDGRSAYATPHGQLLVSFGLALVVACWWWAGRIMTLPAQQRVFER